MKFFIITRIIFVAMFLAASVLLERMDSHILAGMSLIMAFLSGIEYRR